MISLEKLHVRTRLALVIAAALLGLLVLASFALIESRNAAMNGHQERIKHLVEAANGIIGNYQKLEADGKLPRAEAQKQAMEALRPLRFASGDYFFIYDFEGNGVMVAGSPKIEGQNMLGKTDAAGFKLWDSIVSTAKGPGAGYINYVFPRAGQTEAHPKLAYVAAVPGWQWIVGTGVYVDDVNAVLRRQALRYALVGVLALLLAGVIGGLAARSIVRQLGGEPAQLMEIMQHAANGDLNTRFPVKGDASSVLAKLKIMLEGLGVLIRDIHASSTELSSNASKVAQSAQQVSEAALQQSDATSSMAAGIEEMTVAVNHIADSAQQTETESKLATELGAEGEKRAVGAVSVISDISATVSQAGERIGGLVKRTDEIGSIANVIKEIAAQTNLLALNAAIEAARAGEQGRGFAVVADEVRKLAERTTQATADITGMVTTIQTETREAVSVMESAVPQARSGVASAEAAAQSLREMRNGAEGTLGRIREVADATREQGLASNSIAQQVERIAMMVEETSQAVAGSAETARQLEGLAHSLHTSVSRFRV
ncbi:methyl-accepting chemotaxis protein [Uliginosibacterium flavum]|uniref:Methyl-accepting chemotaxis protein n=1 Tax=Uliginosibacterium flavum TaxID=1396831 RepID=A0ABV2TNF5_9RHOO